MSQCTLPFSLLSAKFLGASDRLVVAGNSGASHGIVEVQYVEQDSVFLNKCEFSFVGRSVTATELCGVGRLGKSILAVGTAPASTNPTTVFSSSSSSSNSSSSSSSNFSSPAGGVGLDLLDVVAAVDGATIKPVMSLRGGGTDGHPPLDASSLVSLSFYGDQEVLAAGGEEGDVALWDLGTGKQLRRFCADACGLTQIEFTRSGQLITCGMATTHQLQMWDVRCSGNRAVAGTDVTFARALQHPAAAAVDGDANYTRRSRSQLYYTSVSTQSLYNKVLCGTSRGGLAVWDLRSEAVAQYQPHAANAQVTAVLAHPWKQDLLVSASTDGTVKTTDLLRQGGAGDADTLHTTVVTEPAAFRGVDCDRDSGLLAAYSTLGGLWRLQLS